MKNKNQDKPMQVIITLFVLGVLLGGNIANIMVKGDKYTAILIIASIFMLIFLGVGVYLLIKAFTEKGKEPDESAIICMQKAGYYTFAYTVCAVVIASAVLRFAQVFSNSEQSIFSSIDAEVVFAIFCLITQLSIMVFTVLYFVFLRKMKK